MSDMEFDPDIDVDDLANPPDPLRSADVTPTFGATTQFPDGSIVDDPKTDALGYVYPTPSDYIAGTNKAVPED